MSDKRRVADEIQKSVADFGVLELGLADQGAAGDAVHPLRLGIDVALWIDIDVEELPRRQQVVDLDAGDFDQPVSRLWIKPGGFSVEYDLTRHVP